MEVLSKGAGRTPQASRSVDQKIVVPKSLPNESTTSLPLPGVLNANQTFVRQADGGEVLEVAQQVQLYAPNGLLRHPLVSPAMSYLGGLPPLFIIAGDREVLRDEIIYTCVLFPSHFSELIDILVEPIEPHIRINFPCVMT